MWSSEAVLPIESNNNICAYSLFSSLVEEEGAATASPTDQHSNSSSLESLDSPLLDDNRALSTSCSENSFEMSSTASRNAGDLPTPSDSLRFCRDSLKHSCDHQLEPDPETKPGSEPSPQMKQLPREEAFKELRSDHCEMIENPIQCIDCKCKPHPKTAQSGTGVREVLNIKSCPTVGATSNGHINCKVESNHAANFRDGWKINSEAEVDEISEVNELLPEASTRERLISATSSTASGSASGGTYSFALYDHACRPPSTSKSMGSIGSSFSSKEALQKSIDAEVKSLDTRLPELDFNKLEEQLNCAAKERQIIERKLLGEQVRRRLALQVDQLTAGPSPRILTRPSRSNLGFRLQTAMNLQVCYMNDMDEEDLDDESSDDDFGVPKSKSAPNLRGQVPDGSNMNATQLRQQIASNECSERRIVLEEETRLLLEKAKETAKMQMELEKLYAPRSQANPRKVTRVQLSKMTCRQIMEIYDQLSRRIDEENAELMRLLVERDSLHMQQDSMLVDIEDMIRHESKSECLNVPEFLKVQASTPSKFRIFKR